MQNETSYEAFWSSILKTQDKSRRSYHFGNWIPTLNQLLWNHLCPSLTRCCSATDAVVAVSHLPYCTALFQSLMLVAAVGFISIHLTDRVVLRCINTHTHASNPDWLNESGSSLPCNNCCDPSPFPTVAAGAFSVYKVFTKNGRKLCYHNVFLCRTSRQHHCTYSLPSFLLFRTQKKYQQQNN